MKRYSPFIIVAVAVITFFCLMLVSVNNRPRQLNQRITLRQKDKIPYGTYVARQLLPSLFPHARINYDRSIPGDWDSLDLDTGNQAVMLIARNFNAEEWELKYLFEFVRNGNYVFIIANSLSHDAANFFHSHTSDLVFEEYFGEGLDSLQVQLEVPPFKSNQSFLYPGRKFEGSFSRTDTSRTIVLGRNEQKKVNFIQMNTGKGSLFVHLAPLAFSNYFLLHKNNYHYFEEAVSVIPPNVDRITWNEYYLVKRGHQKEKPPGLFSVLFQYPEFKWGLLTALFTLVLFVLLEMRRKQRMIPVIAAPRNESLDFVKTIGRLYYDQNNHVDLAKKMSVYFLDYLRSQYKIATHTRDDTFVETVHAKTGYPVRELKEITSFIQFSESAPAISDQQLANFYKQLENFYQNT